MNQAATFAIDETHVAHNDFGDEVVVIQFATGNYYSLRGAAALLWKQLAHAPASTSGLVTLFSDPPADARDHIAKYLHELGERGLIIEVAAGEAANATAQLGPGSIAFEIPQMEAFEDLQALLVADVIHDTDEQGWPHIAVDPAA